MSETSPAFNTRMNGHRSDIRYKSDLSLMRCPFCSPKDYKSFPKP